MSGRPDAGAGDPRIARLREAIAAHQAGEGRPIADRLREERLAVVRERALRLLDVRDRSEAELADRLRRPSARDPEPEEELILETLADLRCGGLLDDARFAREWVRQRSAAKGRSRRALDIELRGKGVSEEHRRAALGQIDAEDEEATARELAERRAARIRREPGDRAQRERELRRIVGVLARRGFPEAAALRHARAALDARIAELGGEPTPD